MEERLVPLKEVMKMVGFSKQHIARLEAAGKFPTRIKPGGRNGKVFYLLSEILKFIADLAEKRAKRLAPTM